MTVSTIRGGDGFDSSQYVNLLNTYTGRNKIINGGFDLWQRSASQTSVQIGVGADDRWYNSFNTPVRTTSRQEFPLGQTDVPGSPKYFARTVVSSASSADTLNAVIKTQYIERADTLSGKTATLSFWAKSDTNRDMSVSFYQGFGSGGSPSANVNFGPTKFSLTSSWQEFTVTVDIPSVYGKVLGSAGDDFLAVQFWFTAGSGYSALTAGLGTQTGTWDISNVQFEEGNKATPFEQKNIREIIADCQRYYESGFIAIVNNYTVVQFVTPKRAIPTLTFSEPSTAYDMSQPGYFRVSVTTPPKDCYWTASAEL